MDAALQAAGGGARVADDGASAWDGAAGTLAGRSPAAAVDAIAEAVEALGLSLGGVHIDASLVGTAGPVRAWTVPVDPPRDVRVWVRAPHAPAGWRALAHELGHAAFARAHDPALPWGLRGGTPRAVHEAVALVVERVAGARRPAGSVRSPARVADPLGAPAYAAGARLGAVVAARLAGQPPAAVGRALAPALAAGGAVAAGEWLARCGAPGARVSRAPAGRARRTPER
ncbi:MAG: hypothetical protein D6689_09545 [Deltaproteobacteria bacterium]|nr:MAG: hypothetical protein D6689_09545 [Deltaproteobacteria bacterium]